jgi:hypothetical protein
LPIPTFGVTVIQSLSAATAQEQLAGALTAKVANSPEIPTARLTIDTETLQDPEAVLFSQVWMRGKNVENFP